MQRVLITGMSGTGKTSLIRELARRGYKAVDTDDDWPAWVTPVPDTAEFGPTDEPDWQWREDLIQGLLSSDDADLLFISGCATNQGKFYPQFDHVILLSAPPELIVERLATRTNNSYGKRPEEVARVLSYKESVEPRLRRTASLEIDTRASLDEVVEKVLALVRPVTPPPA